jgi:hypothetical protein
MRKRFRNLDWSHAKELSQNGHSLREIGEIIGISKSQAARDVPNGTEPLDAVATLATDEKASRWLCADGRSQNGKRLLKN